MSRKAPTFAATTPSTTGPALDSTSTPAASVSTGFTSAADRPDLPTYARDDAGWRRLQALLPEELRLRPEHAPREEWLPVGRFLVHVDRYEPDAGAGGATAAPATLVLVHGGGGNGRLLAVYGQLARAAGFAALAPDLPGYGLTRVGGRAGKRRLVYEDWRATLAAVLRAERARHPDRPIVLFGLSLGGMLAYDAMARTRIPARLLATTLMPTADPAVHRRVVRWPWLAAALPVTWRVRAITDPLPVVMRWAADMAAIANDPAISRALATDPRAGGTWMPGRWTRTMMTARPEVAPGAFDVGPVTLAHPADDRWTPPALSVAFLERLARVGTRLVMLEGAGHLPVEQPGRDRLHEVIVEELRLAAAEAATEASDAPGFAPAPRRR